MTQDLSLGQRAGVRLVRAVSAAGFGLLSLRKRGRRVPLTEFAYGPHRDERLDLLRPSDPAARPGEAVFYLHGGGWISCGKQYYPPDLAFLCEAGYTVFNVEYPLAPEHPHPEMLRSVLRAAAWIRRRHPEIGRVHMMGDSAGANLAAMYAVLYCNPELMRHIGGDITHDELPFPASLVSLYGLMDRGTLLGDDPDRVRAVVRLFLQSYGGLEALRPGRVAPHAAITPMDLEWQAHPPSFLGVGDIDFLHDSSVAYAAELARRGVPCTQRIYPGAPHGFFNMNHAQTPALRRDVLEFLAGL